MKHILGPEIAYLNNFNGWVSETFLQSENSSEKVKLLQ
jgi:hypothetical protein